MADRRIPQFLGARNLEIAQSLEETPLEMGRKEIICQAHRPHLCIQAGGCVRVDSKLATSHAANMNIQKLPEEEPDAPDHQDGRAE